MIKLIGRSELPALVGKNINITYNRLLAQIDTLALVLKDVRDKRIVIFSENRPEWILALYAAWKNGAIVVPVDVLSSREDVAYILHDCDPRAVFCSAEKQGFVQDTLKDAGRNPEVLVFENVHSFNPCAVDCCVFWQWRNCLCYVIGWSIVEYWPVAVWKPCYV